MICSEICSDICSETGDEAPPTSGVTFDVILMPGDVATLSRDVSWDDFSDVRSELVSSS